MSSIPYLSISGQESDIPTANDVENLLPKEYYRNSISKENQLDRSEFMPAIEVNRKLSTTKSKNVRRKPKADKKRKSKRVSTHKSKRHTTKKLRKRRIKKKI